MGAVLTGCTFRLPVWMIAGIEPKSAGWHHLYSRDIAAAVADWHLLND